MFLGVCFVRVKMHSFRAILEPNRKKGLIVYTDVRAEKKKLKAYSDISKDIAYFSL